MLKQQSYGNETACNACHVFEQTEWKLLPQQELKNLTKTKKYKAYQPGEYLFSAGEPCEGVFCIQDGKVGLWSLSLEGDTALRHLFGPGEIVGIVDLYSTQTYNMFCKTIKKTNACFIDKALVQKLINEQAPLCAGFLKKTADRIAGLEEDINDDYYLPLRARFCKLLAGFILAEKTNDNAKNLKIYIPIRKKTIAAMLHSRPESISRIIKELRDENILSFHGKFLYVSEFKRLLREFN